MLFKLIQNIQKVCFVRTIVISISSLHIFHIKKLLQKKEKHINKACYERRKEKNKMRRISNEEGNSQNTTYLTNMTTVDRILMDITNASPRTEINVNSSVRDELLSQISTSTS